jgi:hypothetical protein
MLKMQIYYKCQELDAKDNIKLKQKQLLIIINLWRKMETGDWRYYMSIIQNESEKNYPTLVKTHYEYAK